MNLIIFDIDGTLLQNNNISNIAFKNTLSKLFDINDYDTTWDNYNYTTDIGILREIYFNHTGHSLTWEKILTFEKEYFDNYMLSNSNLANENDSLFPGTKALFEAIKKSEKWEYGIYTGGFRLVANLKLNTIGIDPFYTPVAYAQDGLDRVDIFRVAYERAKLLYNCKSFKKIILVGDSPSDIKVASHHNISMIQPKGAPSIEQLKSKNTKIVMIDYQNINSFFETIESL